MELTEECIKKRKEDTKKWKALVDECLKDLKKCDQTYEDGYSACMDFIRDTAGKSRITRRGIEYYTIDHGRIVVLSYDVFRELEDMAGFE